MSTFLTAEWRKLIMAQYEVPPAVLEPLVPRGVELDLFSPHGEDQRCYASLVGFLFDRVRVKGVAVPFHTRFPEVNLRFYVRRRMADGSARRGVVFVREFVPRHAITLIARTLYEEPYRTMPMRSNIAAKPAALKAQYNWKLAGRWHELAVTAEPEPQAIPPGSVEEFLTEHYFGYTLRRNGATSEYPVQHPRWQMYPVLAQHIAVDFAACYGPDFAFLQDAPLANILLAEGSPVSVLGGSRLTLEGNAA